jgi:hypothetical protein
MLMCIDSPPCVEGSASSASTAAPLARYVAVNAATAFAAVCAQDSHLCDIVQVMVHKVLLGLKCYLHSLCSSNSAGSHLAVHSDTGRSHPSLLLLLLLQSHLLAHAYGTTTACTP